MMYSNLDILDALKSGQLVIEPFNIKSARPAGVTLHLGPDLLKPIPGTVVDIKRGILPEYEALTMKEGEPYELAPQEFLLGHTLEDVTVGSKLGFFIEGRSTLARVGLTVVKTAMLVQPGHRKRTITLELANHGPNPILLYPKMKVAKAALFEIKTPTDMAYDQHGKYRIQTTVGKPIFKDEFMTE